MSLRLSSSCKKCKLVYVHREGPEETFHQAVCPSVARLSNVPQLADNGPVTTPRGLKALFSPRTITARVRIGDQLLRHEASLPARMLATALFAIGDVSRERQLIGCFAKSTQMALEAMFAERLLHNRLQLVVESYSSNRRLHVQCVDGRDMFTLVVFGETVHRRASVLMRQPNATRLCWGTHNLTTLHPAYWDAQRALVARLCPSEASGMDRLMGDSEGILPAAFCTMFRNLQWLSAPSCTLSRLPESFGQMRHLVDVNLSGNSLRKLPDSFSSLVHLEVLDVSNNLLCALPPSCDRLVNLQQVNLSHNELEAFPLACAVCWTRVEVLDLYRNALRLVPAASMAHMPVLEKLSMGGNFFGQVPVDLYNSESLRYVNICMNTPPFTAIPAECSSHATILTVK